jgi:hypothetical protein
MMIGVDIRTLLLKCARRQLCELENGPLQTTPAMLIGPSAVAGGDAVGLTVAALPAHIGAKL